MIAECVNTTGVVLDKDGYPRVKHNKRLWRLNRLIYTFAFGDIPEGAVVGHRCNNKGCINPNHLYLTTAADNSTDAARDGLYFTGHHNEAIKDAEDNWPEIFRLYNDENMSQENIGKVFNISQPRVSEIIRKYRKQYSDNWI